MRTWLRNVRRRLIILRAIYLDTIILTALIQKQLSCKLLANRIQDAIDKVYRFRS